MAEVLHSYQLKRNNTKKANNKEDIQENKL